MEDISLFKIREFVQQLKLFEEQWNLFEIKEQPVRPAGSAQANLALKKGGKGTQDLPPLDKKEIERSTTKFTTASFKAHMKKCNEASWNKQSGHLCY